MNRCAVPAVPSLSGDSICAICSSARSSARGLRVNSTDDASARYSRWRDTAIATSCEIIGATAASTITATAISAAAAVVADRNCRASRAPPKPPVKNIDADT